MIYTKKRQYLVERCERLTASKRQSFFSSVEKILRGVYGSLVNRFLKHNTL